MCATSTVTKIDCRKIGHPCTNGEFLFLKKYVHLYNPPVSKFIDEKNMFEVKERKFTW